jgi:fluoride ion exporter CrcB/FEX
MIFVAFFALAAVGSVIRWKTALFFGTHKGTFLVNVIGSFCLGLVIDLSETGITLIGLGGLGSLTTFSTFCANIDSLSENNYRSSLLYALLTVIAGVLAATIGLNV